MSQQRPHRPVSPQFFALDSPIRRISLRVLDILDVVVYVLVGVSFIVAAFLALGVSLAHLVHNLGIVLPFDNTKGDTTKLLIQNVLEYVSDLLLVLIIMEVLGTVRSYLSAGDTSVKPFLFIGMISATRGVLSIGARLSVSGASFSADEFRNAMIELSVNALVIIALGATIRILGRAADQKEMSIEPLSQES